MLNGNIDLVPMLVYGHRVSELRLSHLISRKIENTLSLPKKPGKLDYGYIQDTHRLLIKNTALIESPPGGSHNGHLFLVQAVAQYALTIPVPFDRRPNPVK